jgi:hypothetical protein
LWLHQFVGIHESFWQCGRKFTIARNPSAWLNGAYHRAIMTHWLNQTEQYPMPAIVLQAAFDTSQLIMAAPWWQHLNTMSMLRLVSP